MVLGTRRHQVRWRHPREHLVLCAGRNETSVGLNDALVSPRQPDGVVSDGAAAQRCWIGELGQIVDRPSVPGGPV